MNDLVAFDTMEKMALAVSKSKLWKTVDTPEKAIALMLLCQSEGLHPMTAVRRYDLIQGVPALKSEAQLAEFYKRGGVVKWIERSATACRAKFSHPKHCPDGVEIAWTMDDARKAGLATKDNWVKFPRQMLSARVAAEGVQVVDPGAGLGMLTQEEAVDMQNTLADAASQASSDFTGQPMVNLTALPEVPAMEEKEFKKLRAELNKPLQACETLEEFRKACMEFQDKYTRGIWVRLTMHNSEETFSSFAQSHQMRVTDNDFRKSPEGLKEWREALAKCKNESEFLQFENAYSDFSYLQTQENQDALTERGKELMVKDYIDTEAQD